MKFVTNEKLTIVGAAGMIGSNMAQTAIMMNLTPNICLYDPYAPGLEGVAEELYHCGFEGVNITYTSDIKEALTDAKYIINSGGAARKAGMTREDLLKCCHCRRVRAKCKEILSRCKTYRHHLQSGRYYRSYRTFAFGIETVSGYDISSSRLYPITQRIVQVFPNIDGLCRKLPYLRRTRRANGCVCFYGKS